MAKTAEEKLSDQVKLHTNYITFSPRIFGLELVSDHSVSSVQYLKTFLGVVDALATFYERKLYNDNDRKVCKIAADIKNAISLEYGWPMQL